MAKMQRVKGHSYEREVAKKLQAVFPDAKRHLEFQKSEASLGIDIENTGALCIQCKRMKSYAPISKIKEVKKKGIHVLVTKGDREKDVAVLYLDDFIAVLKDIGVVFNG